MKLSWKPVKKYGRQGELRNAQTHLQRIVQRLACRATLKQAFGMSPRASRRLPRYMAAWTRALAYAGMLDSVSAGEEWLIVWGAARGEVFCRVTVVKHPHLREVRRMERETLQEINAASR